jgi:hypothetical protein
MRALRLVVAVNDRVTCCSELHVIRVNAEVCRIGRLTCRNVRGADPSHADETMLTFRCLAIRRIDYHDP